MTIVETMILDDDEWEEFLKKLNEKPSQEQVDFIKNAVNSGRKIKRGKNNNG